MNEPEYKEFYFKVQVIENKSAELVNLVGQCFVAYKDMDVIDRMPVIAWLAEYWGWEPKKIIAVEGKDNTLGYPMQRGTEKWKNRDNPKPWKTHRCNLAFHSKDGVTFGYIYHCLDCGKLWRVDFDG